MFTLQESRVSHRNIEFSLEPVANSFCVLGLNSIHLTLLPWPLNVEISFSSWPLLISQSFAVISPETDTSWIIGNKTNYWEKIMLAVFQKSSGRIGSPARLNLTLSSVSGIHATSNIAFLWALNSFITDDDDEVSIIDIIPSSLAIAKMLWDACLGQNFRE